MRRIGLWVVLMAFLFSTSAFALEEEPEAFFSDATATQAKSLTLDNGYRFEGFPAACEPARADDGDWVFGFFAPDDAMAEVRIAAYDRESMAIAEIDAFVDQMRVAVPDGMEETYLSAGATAAELLHESEEGYLYQIGYLEPEWAILYTVTARQAAPDIEEILSVGHQLYDPQGRKVSAGQYYFDLEFNDALELRVKGLPYGIDARTEMGVTEFLLQDFEDEAFRRMTLSYYGLPDQQSYAGLSAEDLRDMAGYPLATVLGFAPYGDGHFDLTLMNAATDDSAPYVFVTGTIVGELQLICVLEYAHWTAPWYFHDIAHEIDIGGIEIVTHAVP